MSKRVISPEERQRRIQKAIHSESSPFAIRNRRELDKNLRRLERIDDFVSKRVMSSSLYLITDALKRFFANRALYYAAVLGKIPLAEKLIDTYGADINYRGGKVGHTPLHQALIGKRLGMAEYLLKKGAKIRQNKNGDTPLVWACAFGGSHDISVFHRYGFDFNKPDVVWNVKKEFFGWGRVKHYPVAVAFACHNPKVLQKLIDTGVRLDIPVFYSGIFHKRKTLQEVIEDPEILKERSHPECVKIVRQALANRHLQQDHIRS